MISTISFLYALAYASIVDASVWEHDALTTENCPTNCSELRSEYSKIFPNGNRNAASHLWASRVLKCASVLDHQQIKDLFKCFCPVSGSPITPDHAACYKFGPGDFDKQGALLLCCWPCICDAKTHFRVKQREILDKDDETETYDFLVLHDPCRQNPRVTGPGPLSNNVIDSDEWLLDVAPDVVCEGNKQEGFKL